MLVRHLIKKEAILLTAVLSLLFLSFPRAQATPGPMTIQVYPNTVLITPANMTSTFQLEIRMIDAHDVAGIQFRVEWNSTILTCTSAVLPSGHFMDPEGVEETEGNLWKVIPNGVKKYTGYADYGVTYYDMPAAQSRGTVPRSGNGTLAKLTMNATALGTTTIHFDPGNTVLGDAEANPLVTVLNDGTVNVIPELNLALLALLLPVIALVVLATRKFVSKKN